MRDESLIDENKTNLEYIKVFGLFNNYNISVSFKKQANVFIGENGSFKTTMLKFLYAILKKDFNKVMNIPFSGIEVKFKNDNKTYNISKFDIIDMSKHMIYNDNIILFKKAITDNINQRIIYLTDYREMENDFNSLAGVKKSIDLILEKIRSLAIQGFTEMNKALLEQYINGISFEKELDKFRNIDKKIIEIIFEQTLPSYKHSILELLESNDSDDYRYLYLLSYVNRLVDSYMLRKDYEGRVIKFVDMRNKYLNNIHFKYNQSLLDLKVYSNIDTEIIHFAQLSSGEKQIISLFSKLYLESDKNSIVIIDEPELSLHLSWQRMLLPDIKGTGNCDLLVIATHSPEIISNEFSNNTLSLCYKICNI